MSLFKSAGTVSFYISLSRIIGFVRDVFIAKYLGAGFLSDIFFAAFRLPNFFRRIFGEGALNSAFVPIFIEKKGGETKFARDIFSLLFYFLLIFVLILEIFMPLVMRIFFPGFLSEPDKFSLLVNFSRITIGYLIFISLVALCSAILNSYSKFAVPAASPIILNATLIASIFALGNILPNYGYALSVGVFVAGILQFLWLFFFTIKFGIVLYPSFPTKKLFLNSDIKKFFKRLLPAVVGGNVMQINLLLDSVFASTIAGAMSYLYYADRINQLPLAMIGIAIGVALLPAMSRKIMNNEVEKAIHLQNRALEIGLLLAIPATLALTCLSTPIIATLFERGEFTADKTALVAKALLFYSLGLPAYILVKVMEPAFFCRGDTKSPMRIAVVCLFSNLALNLILIKPLGYIGIVLASIISSYLNLMLLLIKLLKKKHFYFEKNFLNKLTRILLPSILMAISLIFLRDYFFFENIFNSTLELIIMIASGGLIYLVSSYFSGSMKLLLRSRHIIS
jgi:putative peptidoglycan lipid II flippase